MSTSNFSYHGTNPEKENTLKNIIDSVFNLDDPAIDIARKKQINEFITFTINGDNPETYLPINANINNQEGAIVFVLTDLRLIKIDITSKNIESNVFPLSTFIGINRKLTNDNRIEITIAFQNGSFNLRYNQEDQNITNFFQKIDQGMAHGQQQAAT